MKKFLSLTMILLFSTLLNAQTNYESNWKKVQEFENKGLPKSALTEVEIIYNQATAIGNSTQIIKCVLYKSKYALTLEEDAQLSIINNIKKEITKAKSPEKNVLESVLANLYWQYFQQNRYKFYNRTNTSEKVDESDFRTWDLHTIFKEIDLHFQNAMQNGLVLKSSPLSKFDAILSLQEGSKTYRPTVYDFIANKALDFYKIGESNLTQPANKFEIDKSDFLGDNQLFVKADFSSKDTTSQKLNALKIYKNLTAFHLKDTDKTALVDATLSRLDFVKQNARFTNKDEIYLETLKTIQQKYRNDKISTEIDFRIAQYYHQLATKYNSSKKEEYQFKFQKAIEICDLANSKFPKSNGAKKCLNLKNQIINPSIQLTNESNIVVNKESRILVKYKNLNKVYFRVYKSNRDIAYKLNRIYINNEKLKTIEKLEKINEFSSVLKNEEDFQQHSTEIIIPKLPQGEYVIIASTASDFNINSAFATSFIQATNLVLIENNSKANYTYQVVDRETGKPIENAKIHLKNYNTNNYNRKIDKTLITNTNGFANYKSKAHHNQVEVTITKDDDKGSFRYYRLNKDRNHRDNHNFTNNSVFLFTDRSIYRPAQTVYFKGIAVSQQENKSTVIANSKITVILKDANYQEVKTLELTTNEFGSFTGEFILPNNGLTGHFEIVVNGTKSMSRIISMRGKNRDSRRMYGQVGFSVEEYKRPKFSAKFDKITDVFKLNDKITIKGKALAYAGSNITDAKVVYRVKRNVQYPRWWYWYRPYGFNSEAQEITHGETTTNDKGEFEIEFLAQPDIAVNKKDLPVFTYEILADIIDINGETRSTSTKVRVGYHSQTINIAIADKLDKTKKDHKLTVDTKNLNGEFVAAKGTLKIYKVKAPKNVYRNRSWGIPDYQEIPQNEFENLFPHDVYKKEKEELGELVFTTKFDTSKEKEIQLNKIKTWQSGAYIAVADGKDKFRQIITDKAQFSLFSNKDKKVADNQFFDIQLDKNEYNVGEKAELKIGTASKDMTVVVYIEKDNKIVDTKLIHLNNEIKTIYIPVEKEDLGGFGISYHLVNYNSFLGSSLRINVPYEKMDLEIETLTFRDKLQPASEEVWSFKIKGNKKDKVLAEILTSMYDSSLDQFKPHNWNFKPIYNKHYYPSIRVNSSKSFGVNNFRVYQKNPAYVNVKHQGYDDLNWFGLHFGYSKNFNTLESVVVEMEVSNGMVKSAPRSRSVKKKLMSKPNADLAQALNGSAVARCSGSVARYSIESSSDESMDNDDGNLGGNTPKSKKQEDFGDVKIRTNFKETAFFFPQLKTDKDGNVSFSFTAPESLTKWKMQLLAHTKDLKSAVKTLETVTQKELMVLPNAPRFLRQGDAIVISSKIANLTDKSLKGFAELQLIDAITNKTIDVDLGNANKTQSFTVDAKGNTNISWKLHIPENIQAVQYKIVAKAGNYSDGEQNVLPVLSNRMLVTETMPMWIRSNQTKTFTLDKLEKSISTTAKNHKLTLEVTSNPAWYAVQALPYLMEYPHECAEQTFSRYYANTLASHIANSNPKIQQVFNQWKSSDALLSNLEKNQELKSLIIQETPWLRDAQSETEQKKRIALLFDLNKMTNEQKRAIDKLKNIQMSSGGFPWFKGSRYENRYITQHIVAGFGHLKKLNVIPAKAEISDITSKAIQYLDNQILIDYNKLLERAERLYANETNKEQKIKDYLTKNNTSHFQVHYLYARSFFKDLKIPNKVKTAFNYYTNQSFKYWQNYNLYNKGMIALNAHRTNNNAVAEMIVRSLKENSITSEELGMYWKENTSSYYWYQAPIETQALMIEVFSEINASVIPAQTGGTSETVIPAQAGISETVIPAQTGGTSETVIPAQTGTSETVIPAQTGETSETVIPAQTGETSETVIPAQAGISLSVDVDNLKIWLLKNKQTNRWKTTKATTEAVYALLLQGTDWISTTKFVDITIGNKTTKPLELEDTKVEAGTGYYKTSWNGAEITPKMAEVTIKKEGNGIAWGAMYWQYFEDLDKITMAETPLKLTKKLFLKTNEDRGEKITEITSKTKLKLGDLVRVRIELRVDRAMEFIHMKDMRAAGFEPVNVISKYKWQDGLGYYESTKDASTNFFIDYLPKGVYIFEYDLRVNNQGDFSNGITTIQSMYAPEFSSHSKGVRVVVE